jgi:hypothetical protein
MEKRPIPGFPGYFAGSDGNIYSHRDYMGGVDLSKPGRKLKTCECGYKHSYLGCTLRGPDKKSASKNIHSLIAEAFHGKRPEGFQCSHLNGNPKDNRPENLKWESAAANNQRKREHGTDMRGPNNVRAKYTKEEIEEMRLLWATRDSHKKTCRQMAALFDTDASSFHAIVTFKRYKP